MAARMHEHNNIGDTTELAIYEDIWAFETFTPEITHYLTGVKLLVYNGPQVVHTDVTVSIRELDLISGFGEDLTSNTFTREELTTDNGVIATIIQSMASLGNGIAIMADRIGHIFRSIDYGVTWTDLGVITGSGYYHPMAYLEGGIAIIGDGAGRIYRSTDYGVTWTDLGVITLDRLSGMTYLEDGIAICADHDNHVYRSTDYGATWVDLGDVTWIPGPRYMYIFAMTYLEDGIVILADDNGHIFRSIDYGLNWADMGAVVSRRVFAMVYVPYMDYRIVYLGSTNGHVYISIDYGVNWLDLGEIAGGIYAMAYLGNGVIILGDTYAHVYRSIDYGANWTDLGVIASSRINSMASLGDGKAILGDYAGRVYYTTDYGATWLDHTGEWKEIRLPRCRVNAGSIYAIILRCPGGDWENAVCWRASQTKCGVEYDGFAGISGDGGESWFIHEEMDFMFEEWGVKGAHHIPWHPTEPNRGKVLSRMGSL